MVSAKKQSMPIVLHQLRRCRISKLLPAYARSILESKLRLSATFFTLRLHVFPDLTYKTEVNNAVLHILKGNVGVHVRCGSWGSVAELFLHLSQVPGFLK